MTLSLRYLYLVLILFALVFVESASAQNFPPGEFFLDTFDDGDRHDSDPVYWRRGGFFAEADIVVDGDFQIQGIGAPSSVAPTANGGPYWSYDDVSITTQVRILEGGGPTSVGVYGRARDPRVYFGTIQDTGMLFIGETDSTGAIETIESFQTQLDPLANDVLLRMDFQGDLMSLTAWLPEDPMPAMPQLTYRDGSLSSGTIAMLASGAGDVAFRWFEAAAVPEPSGLFMVLCGALPFLGLRTRRSWPSRV